MNDGSNLMLSISARTHASISVSRSGVALRRSPVLVIKGRGAGSSIAEVPQAAEANVSPMTRAIVNKLLHDPTMFLKERKGPEELQVARDIFRLGEDGLKSPD